MTYRVTYYDGRGICEPIRMILSYGGAEFEDIRVPIIELPTPLPAEIKEKCTWGQVPLIEFEGKKLCQSLAITRYLAKKYNLVPKDDFEAALCDEYVDTIRELMMAFGPLIMEQDEVKKQEKLVEIKKTTKDKYLLKLQSIVKANGGQRIVGKALTWTDIYFAHALSNIEHVNNIELLNEYPVLKTYTEAVFSEPKIKAWIAKRPKTRF